MALETKRDHDALALLASAARTAATGEGDSTRLAYQVNGFAFTLDVTVDESTAADKLNVYVQTKLDGTNWTDVVHFTEHLGNAGAKRYITKIVAQIAQAEFEVGTPLGAAGIRNLFGDEWRVRWAITNGSQSASFTFSVTACPM